jgi:hypothetical protein
MKSYECEVTETIEIRKIYWVNASSEEEARAKAESGDTYDEEEMAYKGISGIYVSSVSPGERPD